MSIVDPSVLELLNHAESRYSSENSLGGKGEHFMDSQAVF